MSACSSSSSDGFVNGSLPSVPSDASGDDVFTGLVLFPDAGGDGSIELGMPTGVLPRPTDASACGGHLCGTVAMPQDAGVDAGDAGSPSDAGAPQDAADDATGPCHPVCGIIVRPDE